MNNKRLFSIILVVFIDLLGFSLILPLLPYYAETFKASQNRLVPPKVPPLSLPNLQSLMWDKVGIVRAGKCLEEAEGILAAWESCLPQPGDRPSYELSNLVLCARLVTEAALLREESRGAHFRTDFPQTSPEWQRHIVFRKNAVK